MMRLLLACMSIVLLASNVELNRSRRRRINVAKEMSMFVDSGDLCVSPEENLGVEQGGTVVNFGTFVSPADTQYPPTIEYNNAVDDCLYTIVIVDTCNLCCCSGADNGNNENSNDYSENGPGCTTCGSENGSNNKFNGGSGNGSNNKFNGGSGNDSNDGSDCNSYLLGIYSNLLAKDLTYSLNLQDLDSDFIGVSYLAPCYRPGGEDKEIMVILYQQEAECDVAALRNCQREGFNTCEFAKNNSLSDPLAGNYYISNTIYDFERFCAKLYN